MVRNASIVGLEADPSDVEDFDVAAADVERALHERRQRVGRPAGSSKEQVSLRLDREVVERFRAGGPGWQTRMNEALRKAAGF
jgi:uncharacterized protein (DUF4415 family)